MAAPAIHHPPQPRISGEAYNEYRPHLPTNTAIPPAQRPMSMPLNTLGATNTRYPTLAAPQQGQRPTSAFLLSSGDPAAAINDRYARSSTLPWEPTEATSLPQQSNSMQGPHHQQRSRSDPAGIVMMGTWDNVVRNQQVEADSQTAADSASYVSQSQKSDLSYNLPQGAARGVIVERYSFEQQQPPQQQTPQGPSPISRMNGRGQEQILLPQYSSQPPAVFQQSTTSRYSAIPDQQTFYQEQQQKSQSHQQQVQSQLAIAPLSPMPPRKLPTPGAPQPNSAQNSPYPQPPVQFPQQQTPNSSPSHTQPRASFMQPPQQYQQSNGPYPQSQPKMVPTPTTSLRETTARQSVTPAQPVYNPPAMPQQAIPQEEVCLECAMRDEDMADVDVTSPGIWERDSDVHYEQLKRTELEEQQMGVVNKARTRAVGGMLTEPNVKIWLSVNPREPQARQQTLEAYIKSQRKLLEAEGLARHRAMQEARQLDNKMRDAYSQLRRSAYDTGNSAAPVDDLGGVRIKAPRSPSSPPAMRNSIHNRSQSRDVTLLENGMIVEQIDVRREEKEARERRRKEERRARKSSRGSAHIDATSLYSVNSRVDTMATGGALSPTGDSLRPNSRYSTSLASGSGFVGSPSRQGPSPTGRPSSQMTNDRPPFARAYSTASFSDVHSMGSGASPRRSRFFGFKNLSAGWKSQDSFAPSGMSGSMVDMHVALQREATHNRPYVHSELDFGNVRNTQMWPAPETVLQHRSQLTVDTQPKKKKSGFKKIWKIVTGNSKADTSSRADPSISSERHDDGMEPLAPPPPLSYLVNRGRTNDNGSMRHDSTPSFASAPSPRSVATASSSVLPSPISPRPNADRDSHIAIEGRTSTFFDSGIFPDEEGKLVPLRHSVHNVTSEPDIRQRLLQQNAIQGNGQSLLVPSQSLPLGGRPPSTVFMVTRDKSLPPLPPPGSTNSSGGTLQDQQQRPSTANPYDPLHTAPASETTRRQSFGGATARPNLSASTNGYGTVGYDARRSVVGPKYDDFGGARTVTTTPTNKRKSKFLSSLLGKKNTQNQTAVLHENSAYDFPVLGTDNDNSVFGDPLARTNTRNKNNRMSMASKKMLEERVSQDPDFVAYRYPSNDARLDLLR